ncbi:hypothetical protein JG687_00018981 [Phytophthora cactorum]|uniref:FAD-binding domain-containing protein n=1 Tax=Phytophthora cactorum TaxID=29920 RepID=A0A8T1TJU6_9STRA|nr:hypothetical protein PC120_g26106 [Phytophthora cactorum]KAG3040099.1 hypothetical protein PC121_g23643 [Phytophthora cactorum]KAG4037908.1 hypothetical protein PC123_g26529 [Phytophthora cactorum]KAG6942687.1 hypothetical protein JG687_00018981 [Phytophthora cactorum]
MATLTAHSPSAFAGHQNQHKLQSRPPVYNIGLRDSFERRSSIGDNQDVYIGEGLIDPDGVDDINQFGEDEGVAHKPHQHRRRILDYLAIDVGEKYLDDIYKEDDSDTSDGEESGFYSDGPRSSLHQYHLTSRQEAVVKPLDVDLVQLDQTEEEQASHQRPQKEMAWKKVRRLLVEEEEKAATRKKPVAPTREAGNAGYDTVKLLDNLARSGTEDLYSQSSSSSEAKASPHTFAGHMGNKISQFLHRSPAPHPPSSPFPTTPAQLVLLATLERVNLACRTMELSAPSIAQITSHLTMIDEILKEDAARKLKRGSRRLSSTNDSSEYESESHHQSTYSVANPRIMVAPTVRSSFKTFIAAQDLCETLAAFNNLLADCGLNGAKMQEPWHVYFHIRNAVYSRLGFRQKQLFRLLDARFNLDVYKQRYASKKRVCIVGAGPVGLRAAVELALLGGHVSVLEKRTKFSRENRLHLWPWVVQDLASLGAKVLFKNFCKSRTYFHVSTRQLQIIVLKVALLVGVKVYSATSFQSIVAPSSEKNGNPFYSIKTEPQIPVAEYTAVLGATGVNEQLAAPAGINRFVFSQKESLGIVCYFPNLETLEETKVKEFSWTAQLKHHMLNKMREVGIDLENIVYFRGEMHYLVMTPKRNNLLVRGVVKQNHPNSKDLVRDDNINQSVLHAFVKRIIDFAGIPRRTDFTRVSLFDFTSLTRAEKAASVISSHGKKLYIGLVGDSLLEPVWHEGVGTCRGFLSALDGAWMIAQIGRKLDEQLLADRELAYQVMRRLSGHHRDEMQKNVRKYTVDPKTRYMIDFPRVE